MKSEYNLSQFAPESDTAMPCPYGHYPIYLEPDVEKFLTKLAKNKKINVPGTAGGSKPPANS
ncbi:hypothetical protein AM228_04060 [Planktothricoides sp. SR001]|uniref:hypothetical protein n=1 Tax=Planktothricoides sp. SR001 TaxID=1705388 RepID=UPI0006BF8AA9|nr:hypothetical protein [Planktothricoides sp. SR001]KOR37969.1 hypothetical protein AM228_04060 [Planktothricoides sp. SR001]